MGDFRLMKIINQYDQKKVDSLGRITVPIGLRKRLQIKADSMIDVFTIVDDDGREYVAFSNPAVKLDGNQSKTEIQVKEVRSQE